jgi:hypothetical protein
MSDEMATLYASKLLPLHWIAEDDAGELVMWPAEAGGWARRTVYKGHKRALQTVNAALAYGTGWVGSPGRGRPARVKGDAADERITLRLTAGERTAWEAAAGERSLGDWVRETCNAAIDGPKRPS